MRFLSFFLIILSFPLIMRWGHQNSTPEITEFCVPALGYCLAYNDLFFNISERLPADYGATLTGIDYPFTGRLTAKVDALQLHPRQHYRLRRNELEAKGSKLTQLNSIITDDYYFLSVRSADKLYYFQASSRQDRLVQLELEGPASIPEAIWAEATRDFRVNFK